MSNDALECVRGDSFSTQEEFALYEQLCERGETVASEASDHGWGHHSAKIVVSMDGKFYVVDGGGCSCEGSASVDGPFDTREAAGYLDLPLGDNYTG